MNKVYYLNKLRNCPSTDILDIVTSYMRKKLPSDDLSSFEGAYDHRKAELIMNETYNEVPAEVWRLVC
ncbi:hemolysin [Pantoea sp. Bo_2]|uniref:Hemolysin n=1 Tax=Candidatus Pantoea gossypiicola TaxID=2608008 RepID=A0AB34CH44_9GAMM|nr:MULTISPECIES: Hha/YmoA family nucleoid-associated regulatory protein [Pantoea]KAA5927425.1 hemolysin [Pantoea sp. VH_8]KAA5931764.1 hemolysin [Pantoea sp. VH_4]KAA5937109.1 hemolysin [Pantoea sp. VH_3]KAA5945930.1 hemolysin [Pantoea sp. VH_25]KAA5953009.1 hemolysin [Pantoea sp. VH_24]